MSNKHVTGSRYTGCDCSAVYGFCPQCGAPGVSRERRPNGNDTCKNLHTYPSSSALTQAHREAVVVGDRLLSGPPNNRISAPDKS